MEVEYNRQVNKKVVWIGFITQIDALFLAPVLGIGFATGSYELVAIGFGAFIFYGLFFRVGRPEGYGMHFFKALLTPKSFKAGHISPVYPIRLPDEDSPDKHSEPTFK